LGYVLLFILPKSGFIESIAQDGQLIGENCRETKPLHQLSAQA
jgi:hypothetical protein